jgi:hypothetical protein
MDAKPPTNEVNEEGEQSGTAKSLQGHPALEERLAAVEKELRGVKVSRLLLIGLIVAFQAYDVVSSRRNSELGKFDVVVAEKFVLVDPTKKTRATLGVSASQSASLTFFADKGKSRAAFMVDKSGAPSIGFTGTKGAIQSLMTVDENGPKWALYDEGGKERLSLMAGKNGFPGVYINDREGRSRVRMLVANSGDASYSVFGLCDKYGKTRVMLSVDDKGQPMLNFYDKIEQRYGSLYVEDRNGRPQMYLTDKKGRIIWEAE